MKITLILALCLLPTLVFASPFLVCDPQIGVTYYKLTGPLWVTGIVQAQADGSINMDVSVAIIRNNPLTVAACKDDPLWGEMCSNAVPFAFTRPASPVGPVGIGLKK